jgi:hypothetical protein
LHSKCHHKKLKHSSTKLAIAKRKANAAKSKPNPGNYKIGKNPNTPATTTTPTTATPTAITPRKYVRKPKKTEVVT